MTDPQTETVARTWLVIDAIRKNRGRPIDFILQEALSALESRGVGSKQNPDTRTAVISRRTSSVDYTDRINK